MSKKNDLNFNTICVPEEMEFSNIASELSRTYRFPNNELVIIEEPLALNVSASGGHRVIDKTGNVHYIPVGWLVLSWTPRTGGMHVNF